MLTDWPTHREQATEFENTCAKLTAVILASGPESTVSLTEPLYEATIDSLFQKKNKLRTLPEWDEATF